MAAMRTAIAAREFSRFQARFFDRYPVSEAPDEAAQSMQE
jgi:hypothetical protein